MISVQELKEALGTLPYDSLSIETVSIKTLENQYSEKIQGCT